MSDTKNPIVFVMDETEWGIVMAGMSALGMLMSVGALPVDIGPEGPQIIEVTYQRLLTSFADAGYEIHDEML